MLKLTGVDPWFPLAQEGHAAVCQGGARGPTQVLAKAYVSRELFTNISHLQQLSPLKREKTATRQNEQAVQRLLETAATCEASNCFRPLLLPSSCFSLFSFFFKVCLTGWCAAARLSR